TRCASSIPRPCRAPKNSDWPLIVLLLKPWPAPVPAPHVAPRRQGVNAQIGAAGPRCNPPGQERPDGQSIHSPFAGFSALGLPPSGFSAFGFSDFALSSFGADSTIFGLSRPAAKRAFLPFGSAGFSFTGARIFTDPPSFSTAAIADLDAP